MGVLRLIVFCFCSKPLKQKHSYLKSGSNMVQTWFKHGSNNWFKHGSNNRKMKTKRKAATFVTALF